MNRCVERLYNGIIKESDVCYDAWHVSDACGHDIRHQRNRDGTFSQQ